jgi:hypothetical protein
MAKKSRRLISFTGKQDNHKASTKKAYAIALLERQKSKQEKKENTEWQSQ